MYWSAIGGTDISGEWHRTGGYYSEIRRCKKYNHNYICTIKENSAFKFGEKGWRLFISMGTRCMHMGELVDTKFRTLKEAKDYAKNFIKEYDNSADALDRVEHYKINNCCPVFDMDLCYEGDEYMGIGYTSNTAARDVYDYFNDNPVDYHGVHYTLNIYNDTLKIGKIKCYPVVQGAEIFEDKNLSLQLLDKACKIPSKYYERFRQYKEKTLCQKSMTQ